MALKPREIPFLAGNRASKSLLGVELSGLAPAIVTHGNRQTINHIDVVIMEICHTWPQRLHKSITDTFRRCSLRRKRRLLSIGGIEACCLSIQRALSRFPRKKKAAVEAV